MMPVTEATAVLASQRGEAVVVSTMSGMALWGAEPSPLDFRLLGVMGAAASLGLGLALGRPERPVWVVDGDGSLLMQLGCLVAVAGAAPPNYLHVVVANGVYAVSGAQPLPAAVDWPGLATAAGYARADWAHDPGQLADLLDGAGRAGSVGGPRLIAVVCDPARPDYPAGAFDFDASGQGAALRHRLAGHGR
jgi:thiamine pyrophosphate-dependent acetolactate synthase large subunit-like protein